MNLVALNAQEVLEVEGGLSWRHIINGFLDEIGGDFLGYLFGY